MRVFIVGEDDVTYAITKRILNYCSSKFEIISELPARGGEIKSKIEEFNKLSLSFPVVLLIDLDANNCAPELLNKLVGKEKNENFIFNIANDEAEAWLMADRVGFSDFFGIELHHIPESSLVKNGGMKLEREMSFPYKSSMFLTSELIGKSKNPEIVKKLQPKKGASKGPEYNTGILPFINEKWNIENASVNSNSLSRMISRLKRLIE